MRLSVLLLPAVIGTIDAPTALAFVLPSCKMHARLSSLKLADNLPSEDEILEAIKQKLPKAINQNLPIQQNNQPRKEELAQEVQQEISEVEAERSKLQTQIADAEAEQQALKKKIMDVEANLSSREQSHKEVVKKFSDLEAEHSRVQKKITDAEAQEKTPQKQISELDAERIRIEKQVAVAEAQLKMLQKEVEDLENKRQSLHELAASAEAAVAATLKKLEAAKASTDGIDLGIALKKLESAKAVTNGMNLGNAPLFVAGGFGVIAAGRIALRKREAVQEEEQARLQAERAERTAKSTASSESIYPNGSNQGTDPASSKLAADRRADRAAKKTTAVKKEKTTEAKKEETPKFVSRTEPPKSSSVSNRDDTVSQPAVDRNGKHAAKKSPAKEEKTPTVASGVELPFSASESHQDDTVSNPAVVRSAEHAAKNTPAKKENFFRAAKLPFTSKSHQVDTASPVNTAENDFIVPNGETPSKEAPTPRKFDSLRMMDPPRMSAPLEPQFEDAEGKLVYIGDTVSLVGLYKPEFNGLVGVVLGADRGAEGRFAVRLVDLEANRREISLKPPNMLRTITMESNANKEFSSWETNGSDGGQSKESVNGLNGSGNDSAPISSDLGDTGDVPFGGSAKKAPANQKTRTVTEATNIGYIDNRSSESAASSRPNTSSATAPSSNLVSTSSPFPSAANGRPDPNFFSSDSSAVLAGGEDYKNSLDGVPVKIPSRPTMGSGSTPDTSWYSSSPSDAPVLPADGDYTSSFDEVPTKESSRPNTSTMTQRPDSNLFSTFSPNESTANARPDPNFFTSESSAAPTDGGGYKNSLDGVPVRIPSRNMGSMTESPDSGLFSTSSPNESAGNTRPDPSFFSSSSSDTPALRSGGGYKNSLDGVPVRIPSRNMGAMTELPDSGLFSSSSPNEGAGNTRPDPNFFSSTSTDTPALRSGGGYKNSLDGVPVRTPSRAMTELSDSNLFSTSSPSESLPNDIPDRSWFTSSPSQAPALPDGGAYKNSFDGVPLQMPSRPTMSSGPAPDSSWYSSSSSAPMTSNAFAPSTDENYATSLVRAPIEEGYPRARPKTATKKSMSSSYQDNSGPLVDLLPALSVLFLLSFIILGA